MSAAREHDKFMLRFPDGWRTAIKAQAAKNRRSMNSEILAALEGVVSEAATGVQFGDQAPAAAEVEKLPCRAASLIITERSFRNDRT